MSAGNPGIPRTAGCDDLRRHHIKTRLTDKEVCLIDAFAARLGVSRSAAIRTLILDQLEPSRKPVSKESAHVHPLSA